MFSIAVQTISLNELTCSHQFYRVLFLVLTGGLLVASWELGKRKLRQVSDQTHLWCTDGANEQKLLCSSWDCFLQVHILLNPTVLPRSWDTLSASFSCYLVLGGGLSSKLKICIPLLDLVSIAKKASSYAVLHPLSPRGWRTGKSETFLYVQEPTETMWEVQTPFQTSPAQQWVRRQPSEPQAECCGRREPHWWFYTSIFSF